MATLSEQTLREMEAGARQVALNDRRTDLPSEYLDAILRTQQRAAQLKQWERDGKLRLEFHTRYRTNDKSERMKMTLVLVGELAFSDQIAEETGGWPSEILMANVALALAAGQGRDLRGELYM